MLTPYIPTIITTNLSMLVLRTIPTKTVIYPSTHLTIHQAAMNPQICISTTYTGSQKFKGLTGGSEHGMSLALLHLYDTYTAINPFKYR
jgi:hypothetical protein